MALQMRVSLFHVIFNVSTTLILLPFVKHLVKYSSAVIKEKKSEEDAMSLHYVDDRLLTVPSVALGQVKKEVDYMLTLARENTALAFVSIETGSAEHSEAVKKNEKIINFTNKALTQFLIKLSVDVEESDEEVIGSYFHVLNDLERIGDHAENFHEIGVEMVAKKIAFSPAALAGIGEMRDSVMKMFDLSKDAFDHLNIEELSDLNTLEDGVDGMKKSLISSHFTRLAEGNCSADVSPYYSSVVTGLERVADHLVNVGYSIVNPTGSQKK